jgi:release factor glutamine methyltransferase
MTEIVNSSTQIINARDTYGPLRSAFRKFVHWASYHFILSSKRTRKVMVGDLELTVPPTVFHPGVFVTSGIFADYLRCADLHGKTVVEVGTGSGVLALSAALAGARKVVALDINPAAASAAAQNAAANGLADIVEARTSDLFSAVPADEIFDVVISSPPSFGGTPRDISDRAWHAGEGYEDIHPLFRQAYAHMSDNGVMFILLSSDTNVPLIESLARQAGFEWAFVARKSIVVESFLIFQLTKRPAAVARGLPSRAEVKAAHLRRKANQDNVVLEALAIARVALEGSPDKAAMESTIRGIDEQLARLEPLTREAYLAQARSRIARSSEASQR